MPIAKHLRHFYAGAAWRAVRRRILARAGGRFDAAGKYQGGARCEQCGKPDRETVETITGRACICPVMYWRATSCGWRTWLGERAPDAIAAALRADFGKPRTIRVVLSICHLNHAAGDDRDENLKGLCQWCHLHLDRAAHKMSRATRRDRARPLLVEGAA